MNWMKTLLGAAGLLATALAGTQAAQAATTVNLTAQRASLTLPDGQVAAMWGYCGAVADSSTGITSGGACAAAVAGVLPAWTQGPTIVVPAGDTLTINLSNALPSPTSIVILGQLGGGLGLPNKVASPVHSGGALTSQFAQAQSNFTPPAQGPRMRSFAPEADGVAGSASYVWHNLKPGTYLYESGSRPSLQVPMGLYGVLVVTGSSATPVAGAADVAYGAPIPGSTTQVPLAYDADATILFSEVDLLQNAAVDAAAQAMAARQAPTAANRDAFAALEQRRMPPAGPTTLVDPGYNPNDPSLPDCATVACYPPAVNYAPTYFLVNGQSYDPTNPARTAAIVSDQLPPSGAATGRVLVRFANAGLKTHIPTIVGMQATLVGEDGNLLPDVALAMRKSAASGTPLVSGRLQSSILLTAGKTVDAVVTPPLATGGQAFLDQSFPVIDRELSLSGGGKSFSGLQGYLAIAPAGTTAATLGGLTQAASGAPILPVAVKVTANDLTFNVPANASVFSGNVLATDIGITGAAAGATAPAHGSVAFDVSGNGNFTYTPAGPLVVNDSFSYTGRGSDGQQYTASVTLVATSTAGDTVTASALSFSSQVASLVRVPHPGVLAGAASSGHYSLQASATTSLPAALPGPGQVLPFTTPDCSGPGTCSVQLFADGSFTATASAAGTYSFTWYPIDAQGRFPVDVNGNPQPATASVVFPTGSGVKVTLQDSVTGTSATADYRWVIEEDQTYLHDPANAGFVPPAFAVPLTGLHYTAVPLSGGLVSPQVKVTFGTLPTNFTGFVPGTYVQIAGATTDLFNGTFRINAVSGNTFTYTLWQAPSAGTTPADASSATATSSQSLATSFHRSYMPVVAAGCTGIRSCNDHQTIAGTAVAAAPRSWPADVALDPTKRYFISVLPGDAGDPAAGIAATGHTMGAAPLVPTAAGVNAWSPVTVLVPENPLPPGQMSFFVFEDNNPISGDVDDNEPGLGGFEIVIYDTRGSSGDQAGQITYDLFNQPLTNSLANTGGTGTDGNWYSNLCPTTPNGAQVPVGVIYTCLPVLDRQHNDVSPYTGMALVKNVIPGRIDVQAHPAAWRESAGEHWIQVSTLEGTPNNDSFVHAGEPAYWQEFGPPGFHSFIGFINPAHIAQANKQAVATAKRARVPIGTVTGRVTNLHMDRPPEAKLNDSCQPGTGDPSCARAALNYTQCYVALNSQSGTGPTVAWATCDGDGNFTITNVPRDTYELFIWDEWLDQIKAKQLVQLNAPDPTTGAAFTNGSVRAVGDIPVFNWFTRIQETLYVDVNGNGVRDPGEPGLTNLVANVRFRDGTFSNKLVTDAQGNAVHNELFPLFNWYVLENDQTRYKNTGVHIIYDAGGVPDQHNLATSLAPNGEYFSTLGVLNSSEKFPVPQANRIPGARYATTDGNSPAIDPASGVCSNCTTERIDPPSYITEGLQGFINQTEFVEWGKQPFAPGENGGISGMIYFASVRAFDDPRLKVQNLSEPGMARVQVNLYQRTTNADGTTSDVLVDSTTSASWDDWANGTGAFGTPGAPNMSCPGNAPGSASPPSYVPGRTDPFINYTLGANNQYKCYDGQHAFNQVQPAPYDGYYAFPTANCSICTTRPLVNNATGQPLTNPDGSDAPVTLLPPGQYVVEVVRPDGLEITKEEDKNILIGDTWIAAAPQQFGSPVNIFILPDQATVNDSNPEGQLMAFPPCVGVPHVVPDYLTVVPEAAQVAPFAGQVRNLCDRKLVTLHDQEAGNSDFQLWTGAPIAGHVSGLMLNDAAAEFDPYSPSFGEKFALPNAPISVRDFNGTEILRSYTDKWGTFDFLNVSTWEANVPNPSGYAPNMLTYCMNDPGPTAVPGVAGQYQTDPFYNPQYSDFCYNWPILPGVTTYLDTPVLPVSAFASHYTPVDCQYADATPAVRRVDGNWIPTAGFLPPGTSLPTTPVGPYVDLAAANPSLTITALGDTSVLNPAYAGPTALPGSTYAANRIIRHYGFGGSTGTVQLLNASGGVQATLATPTWSDGRIVATVPANVPVGAYQLVIKTAAGVSSVDTVTVTVDKHTAANYRAPAYVAAPVPGTGIGLGQGFGLPHPIQDAIDSTSVLPGDLVIVDAGTYPELAVMWKPVRLQGVGAAAVTIQATKYPNSKIADWRNRINLLFGLTPDGNQLTTNGQPNGQVALSQIDPLPGQEITGGIVRLEPSALSTEEGAGITVLAANNQSDPTRPRGCLTAGQLAALGVQPEQNFTAATPGGFYPTAGDGTAANQPVPATEKGRFWSDFACYAARIDGISVTGSDAGGGIYVNGWAHYLQISNNRVFGNSGPFSGGVRIGQPYLEGQVANPATGTLAYDYKVTIHHNAITTNGTDEANSAPGSPVGTSGAGGGLAVEAGSDNFTVANNWICGNFSAGDGGGVGILGNSANGSLVNNTIIFNEAYQQTGANYGGGVAVEGEPGTPSTGVGNIYIDSNLIQGNAVRSGSGGGLRLAAINGSEVSANSHYTAWVTNNIIANNVAGWAGAGVSIVDTLYAVIESNTIVNNDAVGTSASAINQPVNGRPVGPTTAVPSPAGIAAEPTMPALQAQVTPDFPASMRPAAVAYSQPVLHNNIVWHNRSFFYDGSSGSARMCAGNSWSQAASHTCIQLPQQSATGQCVSGASYWEAGVLGESSPSTTLTMTNSILSGSYQGLGNLAVDPGLVQSYCNGSTVAPEAQFEPGSPFQPSALGNMTLAATLDESGNYVDLSFGPLSLRNPANPAQVNGNYDIRSTSPAIDAGTPLRTVYPFSHDIHGTTRPQGTGWDIGADEYLGTPASFTATPNPVSFGAQLVRTSSAVQFVTVSNSGTQSGALGIVVSGPFARGTGNNTGSCGANLAGLASCTVGLVFTPTAAGAANGTLAVGALSVPLTGTGTVNTVSVTPPALTFALQQLGTTSAAQSVTVTNTSTVALPLTITKAGDQSFHLASGCPATLAVNSSCTLSVTFAPTFRGAPAGTITVRYPTGGAGSGNSTATVTLSGSAGAPVLGIVAPDGSAAGTYSLGTTIAAGSSATANFTLANTGANTAPFVIGAVTVTASAPPNGNGSYAIVAPTAGTACVAGAILPVGGSCTFGVRLQFPAGAATVSTAGLVAVSGTGVGVATQYTAGRTVSGR